MRRAVLYISLAVAMAPRPASAAEVVAYYDITKGYSPSSIPWKQLTQLNVAFAGIDAGGTCNWVHDIFSPQKYQTYSSSEVSSLQTMVANLKAARSANNPRVRINLSVGGAGLSYGFSGATATFSGAWHVAWSCAGLVKGLGLDGLDYDWEYPTHYGQWSGSCPYSSCGSGSDTANLVALLDHTRYYLPRPYIVSVAVHHQLQGMVIPYQTASMDPFVDFWNIMTYEMSGSWSGGTQLASPMDLSAQSMSRWAGSSGVTRSKVVLGVPFYSKYWYNVSSDRGLGSSGSSNDQGVGFNLVGPRCAGQERNWGCYVVRVAQGAYCYCRNQQVWYTYDGPDQMRAKGAYARGAGLGGVMYWSLPSGDDGVYNLSKALWGGLNG
jgi:chitinase